MDPWLYYLLALLLVLACGGAWLTTLVTMPGNWIVVGLAALFAWLLPAGEDGGRGMSWTAVLYLLALAVLGEIVEFGAGAAGAAKQGASRRSVALSIVGAMVGSFAGLAFGSPIPVLGSLVGAVLGGAAGAFVGAYVGEAWKGRAEDDRIAAGRGAFVGRLWGTAGKLAVGAIMVVIVAWDAFF
ncbi:MAG: DUF456 domain-containing protein [Pirellulales bacterium]